MNKIDFSHLNEKQQEAIKTVNGPVLVLAGAGSGKTSVITYRIAYMIEKDVSPKNILAVTFTNKAANEMKERISKLIGSENAKNITVCTFHALGVRILREQYQKAGLTKNFTIYTDSDLERVVKDIFKEYFNKEDIDIKIRDILNIISEAKSKFISPKQFKTIANSEFLSVVSKVYDYYDKYLKIYSSVDFDDLISKPIEIFKNYPEVLEYYQNRFKYIMVDEYQDTNDSQFMIIDMLAKKYKNIFVVGDDDQSIYGFRGANVDNILQFTKQFAGTKEIKLEQNYRSTTSILNAANGVIKGNKNRTDKSLWSKVGVGEKILCYLIDDQTSEVEKIVRKIKYLNKEGCDYKNIAIIYRSNHQGTKFEEAMIQKEIPYKVVGDTSFYDRKEIRDVLSYLVLLINEKSEVHLKRVINYPARNIGATTVEKLMQYANQNNTSFLEALKNCDKVITTKKTVESILSFLKLIEKYKKILNDFLSLDNLNAFIKEINIKNQIIEENKDIKSGEFKIKNIDTFINNMYRFTNDKNMPLDEYLLNFLLEPDSNKKEEKKDEVTLLTIHAAKGLEFDYVFIPGFNEGIIPHERSIETGNPKDIEEERRLAYVAITRAKKQLIISMLRMKEVYGKLIDCEPSRFIRDIPKNVVEFIDFAKGQSDISDAEIEEEAFAKLDEIFGKF